MGLATHLLTEEIIKRKKAEREKLWHSDRKKEPPKVKAQPSPRLKELYSKWHLTRAEKIEVEVREKYEGRKTVYGWQPAKFVPKASESQIQREIKRKCLTHYIPYKIK